MLNKRKIVTHIFLAHLIVVQHSGRCKTETTDNLNRFTNLNTSGPVCKSTSYNLLKLF